MAASIRERVVLNPYTIESLAILRGLKCCLPLGVQNIIVESNCQTMVNMLLNLNASDSFLRNIFYEIKTFMARSIAVFSLIIGRATRQHIVFKICLECC